MRKLTALSIFISTLALFSFSYAQNNGDGLSLLGAVDMALENNHTLKAAEANLSASEQGIKSAKASYYPSLLLKGNYAHLSKINEMVIDLGVGGVRRIATGSENPYSSDLMLSWDVYTFGKRSASVKLAKTQSESAELNYNQSKKRVFDGIARAYLTAVFTREALALAQTEQERTAQMLNLVKSRYESDLIPEFDYLQMQLRNEKYRSNKLEFENNDNTARLNLARLIQLELPDIAELSDNLDDNILRLPATHDTAMLTRNREDYNQALIAIESTGQAKRITKSAYLPSIAVFTDYNLRNGYQPDLDKIEGSFSFGVNFNWLLFGGFARKAEMTRQDYLGLAARHYADDLELLMPFQEKSARLALENSKSRIEVGQRSLEVAQKAMSIARQRYDLGDITMIELLEAENQLAEAELGLLNLKYQYLLSKLDLKAAMGYYPELESNK